MKLKLIIAAAGIVATTIGSACEQNAGINSAANNSANSSSTEANATAHNSVANTAPSTEQPSADSPTAAYIAAYNARQNKDIATLRSLLSKDIIEFFEIVGEEEKKSVEDMLKELADKTQATTAEVRNERVAGDQASLEYLDEDGTWQPMDLVREDGRWKLTLAMAEPETKTKSASGKK